MVEVGTIEAKLILDSGEFNAGIQGAEGSLKEFSGSAEAASADVSKASTEMSTSVSKSTGSIAKDSEAASVKVGASSAATTGSMKTLAVGFSQTATSAFSLYQAFDNIEKKQYALEKANLAADKATQAVNKAQVEYNDSVNKYGPASEQAALSLERLEFAQETERLAVEKAEMSQGNLNDSMAMAALSIIPSVISGVDGMAKVWGNLKNLDMIGNFTNLNEVLAAHKGALISAGAGLAAIAVIYGAFTTKSEDTRIMLSLLAGGLIAAAAAQWVWNAATAFGLGLTGVGLALVGVGAAAAATVYVLSSQYGAKIEEDNGATTAAKASAGTGMNNPQGGYLFNGQSYSDAEAKDIKTRANSGKQVTTEEISFLNWLMNNYPAAFNAYERGGISTVPQLATISERGEPEIHLTRANVEEFGLRGGAVINNYWNINGARDVDLVMDEIAKRMRVSVGVKF